MSPLRLRMSGCGGGAVAAAWLLFAPMATGLPAAQQVVDLPAEDRTLAGDFPEVFRIGSETEDWSILTFVTSLGFDSSGNLHIADFGNHEGGGESLRVLVVDSAGAPVIEFGRPGGGPGEFANAYAAVTLRDGRTVVPDYGRSYYHVFDSHGDLERMVRMAPSEPEGTQTNHNYLASRTARLLRPVSGSVLLGYPVKIYEAQYNNNIYRGFQFPGPRIVERIDLDGREATTSEVVRAWAPEGAQDPIPPTFLPKLLFDVLPDGGLVYADSTLYEIKYLSAEGELVRILRRPFPSRKMGLGIDDFFDERRELRQDEVEELVGEHYTGRVADLTTTFLMFLQSKKAAEKEALRRFIEDFGGELPVLDGLRTTWDGGVWVRRTPEGGLPWTDHLIGNVLRGYAEATTPAPPARIDVIDPEGNYVGTIPEREAIMFSAFGPNGLVAHVETDEFDVQTVVVRRLPPDLR